MKEEIEEECYRGLTRESKKRNDDCIAKQRLLYPNREKDRERSGKFIVSFFSAVRFVIYVDEETEREKERKKKKKREREIGENHCFIVFSLFCSSHTSKTIRREREIGENHCSIAFSLSRSSSNVEQDFHKV